MNYDQSSSPYQSPSSYEPVKPYGAPAMQYIYPYQFVFENANWFVNILLAGLMGIIPVIGPLVMWGYVFVIVEYLLRRQGPSYPDFDFGKFSEYLMRGIWPFIVAMIVNLVLTPVMLVVIYAPLICGGVMAGVVSENGNEALGGICFLFGMLLMFVAIFAMSFLAALVILPMMMAAGLAQELGPAFNFAFIKDFAAKMWKEVLMSMFVISAIGTVLVTIGYIMLCVGVIPVVGILSIAYGHYIFQLYEIYLARGGMPIPLKQGK